MTFGFLLYLPLVWDCLYLDLLIILLLLLDLLTIIQVYRLTIIQVYRLTIIQVHRLTIIQVWINHIQNDLYNHLIVIEPRLIVCFVLLLYKKKPQCNDFMAESLIQEVSGKIGKQNF